MATYAIGDVQGCFAELRALLEKINYHPAMDTLWFTGDLINRGPDSLQVLRFVKGLGSRQKMVLGNHDLHFLAVALGASTLNAQDTLADILAAPDKDELVDWLRQQSLLHHDPALNFTLVHAGIAPMWDLTMAKACAEEVETALKDDKQVVDFLKNSYGDKPNRWDESLTAFDRLRCITNYFTRMRFCAVDGTLVLSYKGKIDEAPQGLLPWFKVPKRLVNHKQPIVFGHWAALEGKTQTRGAYAIDTGCVWGNKLTALCLETGKRVSVQSKC